MNTEPLTGGCHCGAIRYEAAGEPFHRTACHCSDCRRTSGAPYVAWFSLRPADLHWTAGQPQHYRSSASATRLLCAVCGTQLAYRHDALGEIDITTASLDDPAAAAPQDQTFVRSRLPWVNGVRDLPEHAATRDGAG